MENVPPTGVAATDSISPSPDSPTPIPAATEDQVAESKSGTQILPVTPADPEPVEGPSTAGDPTDRPRRTLKVILRLQPTDEPGYRALLAIGADGCDPLYQSLDVSDLHTALEAIPRMIADAEERWRRAPRYPAPAASARPKPRRDGHPETAAPAPAPAAPVASSNVAAPAVSRSTAKPASPDQLPLF